MLGRAIRDKFPECIFETFEINRVKLGQFQNFRKSKNRPKETCDYLLITSNQQTFCIETNIF